MRRARLPIYRQIVEMAIGFADQALKGGRVVGVLAADKRHDAALLNGAQPGGKIIELGQRTLGNLVLSQGRQCAWFALLELVV